MDPVAVDLFELPFILPLVDPDVDRLIDAAVDAFVDPQPILRKWHPRFNLRHDKGFVDADAR